MEVADVVTAWNFSSIPQCWQDRRSGFLSFSGRIARVCQGA
jgi:endonuclease I